jgi:hypothetical protein
MRVHLFHAALMLVWVLLLLLLLLLVHLLLHHQLLARGRWLARWCTIVHHVGLQGFCVFGLVDAADNVLMNHLCQQFLTE